MSLYVLLKFPEVQKYQELDGFKEHSQPTTHVGESGDVLVDINWLNKQSVSNPIDMDELKDLLDE